MTCFILLYLSLIWTFEHERKSFCEILSISLNFLWIWIWNIWNQLPSTPFQMISYLLKLIKDSFEHDFITWQSLSSLKNFWILPARWQLETSERSQLLDFLRHFLHTRTIYGQCKMCISMILNMFSSIFVDLHKN